FSATVHGAINGEGENAIKDTVTIGFCVRQWITCRLCESADTYDVGKSLVAPESAILFCAWPASKTLLCFTRRADDRLFRRISLWPPLLARRNGDGWLS